MTHYGSVTDADTYFSTQRLDDGSEWEGQDPARKQVAIQQATNIIDRLNFAGSKTVSTQTLEFPRFTDTVVPTPVEHACYEIAYQLLVEGRDPDIELENMDKSVVNQGAGRSRKDVRRTPLHILNGIPSAVAYRMLVPYLKDGRSITLLRID